MEYIGVIAAMDGVPDSTDEILGEDVTLPTEPVAVSNNFDKVSPPIGKAVVTKVGKCLVATIQLFDDSKFPPEVVEKMYGVIGGRSLGRRGNEVIQWELTHMAITPSPTDTRLPPLRRKQ